jgi:hypothetical protein
VAGQRPVPIDNTRNGRAAGGPDLNSLIAAPSGPAHVEGEVKAIVPGKGALVEAGWYDIPGASPAGVRIQNFWKSMPNPIFIRGIGTGLSDGAEWSGMLEPDGSYTYRSLLGGTKTVLAFRVSAAPDPVLAVRSKPAAWQPRGTALDQRSSR